MGVLQYKTGICHVQNGGLEQIPVLSLNAKKLDENTLAIPAGALLQNLKTVVYGDFIMCLYNQARSYEVHTGDSDTVHWPCLLERKNEPVIVLSPDSHYIFISNQAPFRIN